MRFLDGRSGAQLPEVAATRRPPDPPRVDYFVRVGRWWRCPKWVFDRFPGRRSMIRRPS